MVVVELRFAARSSTNRLRGREVYSSSSRHDWVFEVPNVRTRTTGEENPQRGVTRPLTTRPINVSIGPSYPMVVCMMARGALASTIAAEPEPQAPSPCH